MAFSRRHLIVLVTCSLSLFLTSLDTTVVNVALPAIQRSLHPGIAGLEWVVDAYLVVLASLLILSGSTGDRIGRRRMFATGLVLFSAGSLLCSVAPDVGSLVAFRMLQAVGGSMLVPNSLSIITNTFTDARERAVAIGVWAGIFGISAASGPIIGGALVASVGWRAVFWVTVPFGTAALVLARRYVPESKADRPRPIDVPGQVLVAAFLGCLTYAIIEGPTSGWSSPRIIALFAASTVFVVAFAVAERRAQAPLLDLRFFHSPPFSGAMVIAVACFCVLSGFLFLNTLYLQDARGATALMAGVMTMPATGVIILVAPVSGRIVGRWGSRAPLVAAGVLIAAGAALLARTSVSTPYWELALAYVLLGSGYGLANPPITNTAVSGMPIAQAGTAGAVASSARQVGNVLGVALMGALTTSRYLATIGGRLAAAGVPAASRRVAIAVGPVGAGGSETHALPAGAASGGAIAVVRDTFAAAAHAGWELAIGCGVIVSVTALLTTGVRAQAAAARVGRIMLAGRLSAPAEQGRATTVVGPRPDGAGPGSDSQPTPVRRSSVAPPNA